MFWFSILAAFRKPIGLVSGTLGMALSVVMIVLLGGLQEGVYRSAAAFPINTPADLYVAQEGVTRFFSSSFLPAGLDDEIARIEGVTKAKAYTGTLLVVDISGHKTPAYITGYESLSGFGGPWQLTQGRTIENPGEIVLDDSLAKQYDILLGSDLDILGRAFRVVGLSEGTRSLLGTGVFMDLADAQKILNLTRVVNFYLVRLRGGADRAQVISDIKSSLAVPHGVSVLARDEVIRDTRTQVDQLVGSPLSMASGVAFLIGIALIGLIRYNAVLGRISEFATLKALGATVWDIVWYNVLSEAAVALVGGFTIGVVASMGIGRVVAELAPHLQVTLSTALLLSALGSTLIMGLLGSVWPVRRLIRIDPASAFRE